MAEFQKLQIRKFPKTSTQISSETRFWKSFSFPITVKENSAVTCVNFCPAKPHNFAVTSSARVQIFSPATHQVKKTISRFKDSAYSGCFRSDGKLLTAGCENGIVQIFDVNSRSILRQYKGHTRGVRVSQFSIDNLHILSASDDNTVRFWDIPTEKDISIFDEHKDYIRTGAVNPSSADIFVTGSYDHTVKLWDLRSGQSLMTLDHGQPVECVLMYPTGGLCYSSGGNMIKVWDILGGGRLLTAFSNHQKAITSMCLDGEGHRLLSASLDRHVKIYDIQEYKVVHSLDYPSAILSMGLSPDNSHLVVGMADGLVSIKYRTKNKEESEQKQVWKIRGGSYKYFIRGQSERPLSNDLVVSENKKARLRPYDKFLRKFEYTNALDSVLKPPYNDPPVVVSLIQELIRRNGLKIALAGRNEESILPVLYFLRSYLVNPKYTPLLIDVANMVLDMYASILGQSPKVDLLFTKIKERVDAELQFHSKSYELMGALDTLFAASAAKSVSSTVPEPELQETQLANS